MICISITGPDNETALDHIAWAQPLADIIELRLDLISDADIPRLIAASRRPVIATCRSINSGGKFVEEDDRRLAILRKAAASGAGYIDIEWQTAPRLGDIGAAGLIASHHDNERTPNNLAAIYKNIAVLEPEIIKIVTYANNVADNLTIFNLLKNSKLPLIAFCMGDKGVPSRILCRKFGGVMTYAALSPETVVAPGQLTAREIRDVYNYSSIGPETKVYGIIGEDVSSSLSHAYHNLAFKIVNWPGVYVKFPVADVQHFLACYGEIITGLSVTRPHKETILSCLDETSPIVKRVGSVNTVTRIDERLVGDNVDRIGAIQAIEAVVDISGKTALIIGAGGTAKALAFGLRGKGAFVIIVDRTLSKAEKLAKDVDGAAKNFDFLETGDYDILLNATSVGFDPNADDTLVPRECLRRGLVVFDAVYPHTTQLLRDAKDAGCETISGLALFVNQAYEQLKIWLPARERRGIDRAELEKDFYKLVGLHGRE